jgi:hypothetical protein
MNAKYQRRHYIDHAAEIFDLRSDALRANDLFALDSAVRLANRFADLFERDNPRFSRSRFLSACEIGPVAPKRRT